MAIVDDILALGLAQPDRLAAVVDGRPTTYGGLADRIRRARRAFADQGVAPGRVAVLALRDRLDAWAAALALRSLGITTIHPPAGADLEALDLGPVVVVSTEAEASPEIRAAAARAGAPLVLAPSGPAGPAPPGAEPAPAEVCGGHILLTSGTTGAYKKVLIDAANEARNVPLRATLLSVGADSRVNVFDFGPWTAIGHQWPICAWSVGGAIVVWQSGERHETLSVPGLTHTFVHPAMLARLLASPTPPRNDAMALLVGGGALPLALWRLARERLTSDVRTIVGSTETGTFAVTPIETPEDLRWHRVLSPFEIQVVDEQDRPVPAGVTGMIRIRTIGVDGYLDDADASATFFRGGFFYPGDLGVLREDGRLALEGRVNDVINVAGEKRPTEVIETFLQDRLGAVAVCVLTLPEGEEEVIQVVIQPGGPVDPAELKEALLTIFPGVTAARVRAVSGFPRNHMGKIDRAAVRRQLLAGPA